MMFGMMVVMFVSFFVGTKPVYAEEVSNEVEEEIELTEEQMQQVIQWVQGEQDTVSQICEKEFIFVTDDAPDNIMSVLNQRSDSNGYTIRNYVCTYTGYKEVLGVRVDIVTIGVIGEVYVYEDGKVHLYSMRVAAEAKVIGDVEIDDVEIRNSDGTTVAMGRTYVHLDTLLYGSHDFCCWVWVYSELYTGGDDAVIDASIEQV